MVIVRCTRKLLRHLEHQEPCALPSSTTRLGDWFANLLIIRRQHLVLTVSGTTLLPVVIPAAPYKTMIGRLVDGATAMLHAFGVAEPMIATERSAMREAVVATTNDRRILGSMNDLAYLTEGYLEDTESLHQVALKLAECPCSPLGMKSPRETTRAVFLAPTLRLVKDEHERSASE